MEALSEPNAREATADVFDGAMKLVRAELRLLASYGRGMAKRAGVSIAFAWLAMTLTQIALVLVVLSPMLLSVHPWHVVVWTILLAIALASAAAAAAVLGLRSVRAALEPSPPTGSDATRLRSQP